METDLWSSPVELRLEGADHFHCVRNSREALACLATSWPAAHDVAYAEARKKCLMALDHRLGHEDARASFMNAARKAGLLRHPAVPL